MDITAVPRGDLVFTVEGYHGCLRINVHRSSAIYRNIEGWASAIMTPPA